MAAFDDYLGAERARMAAQQPQAPAYQFRDDRNAAMANGAAVQTAQIKANPFAPTPGGAAAPSASPAGGYAGFTADLEAGAPKPAPSTGSNPFAPVDAKAQVSGAISRLLQNPAGAYDAQSAIARQNAVKSNQVANEDLHNQAALQFLPGTGQSFAPAQQQTDQQMLAMRDFDASAAAGHSQAVQQGLQTGAGLGLQQQQQQTSAEQAAKALAETQRQFNETLPIQAAQAKTAADLAQGQLGISQQQIDLNKQLGLGNLSLEQQKVANQASQFATQEDFQKYALQSGMDQHTADLAWQANQTQIQQKFQTGERLSTEEYTTLINQNNQTFQAAQNDLNRTLQLSVQGNQQKFDAAQTAAAQAYDKAMKEEGMSHDDAVQASTQAFQKELQSAGFTQEQATQAAQLSQQSNLAKQQMDLQESMHMADLAQSDQQFGAKLGLDYAQLDSQKEQFAKTFDQHATEFAQQFGLDEKQVNQALQSADFQSSLQRAQIGLELTKNNPDAMQPFAEQMATTLGKALGFTPDQIAAGIKNGALMLGSSTTAQPANNDTVQKGLDVITSEAGNLKSGVTPDQLSPKIQELSTWWNDTGKAALAANKDDANAYAAVTQAIAPLIKAGMTADKVKQAAPWLPPDVIDRALKSAGLA